MKSLAAPIKFVRNQRPGKWTESGVSHHPDRLPDRFAVFPGNHNYRGAKIAHFSQLKKMRDMGVRHVISLSANAYGPQRGPNCGGNKNPCEPDWAKKLGMTWMQVPLGRRPPSDGDWERIRRKLAQGNVYFHCNHGVDRTGAIGARFRKETERGLSDRDVLDRYTYIFGGQWKGAKDRNKFLRAWVQRGRFDPALKSELDKSMTGSAVSLAGMDPKVVAGVSSLVLALGLGAFFLGRRRKEGSMNGTAPGGMRFIELMERGAKPRPMHDAWDIWKQLSRMMEDFADEDFFGIALVVKPHDPDFDRHVPISDTFLVDAVAPGGGLGKIIVDPADERDGWHMVIANWAFLMGPGQSAVKVHRVDATEN